MTFAGQCATDNLLRQLVDSNKTIQQSTYSIIAEFRNLQRRFARDITSVHRNLGTVKDVVDIFLAEEKVASLDHFKPSSKIELVVCGHRCSGKTSFIAQLLQYHPFLPINTGNALERMVKFSYAPSEEACLLVYKAGTDSHQIGSRITLAPLPFVPTRLHMELYKETIEPYLLYQGDSAGLEGWASCLVEICIPSPLLQWGIDVYDIPGSMLLKDFRAECPCFLFLYDDAALLGDAPKYYEELKLSIRNTINSGIFFLNTKVDISTTLESAQIAAFLNDERNCRYERLKNVPAMSNDLPRTLAECEYFDIFGLQPRKHPITKAMTKHAIDRIIIFAVEHALQSTQQVSRIMLDAIDRFFDFVLVTNRRSSDEWDILRNEALHWTTEFFQQYRLQIDTIGDAAQEEIRAAFHERRAQFAKTLIARKEQRKELLYMPNSGLTLINALQPIELSDENEFADLMVEEEVIRPILRKISNRVSQHIDENISVKPSARKNELIRAAFRDFLSNVTAIDNRRRRDHFNRQSFKHMLAGIGGFMNVLGSAFSIMASASTTSEKNADGQGVEQYLQTTEQTLGTIGERIKRSIQERLEKTERNFKEKVRTYHKVVLGTMHQRNQAYQLAHSFAAQFARIECQIVANLDLIKQHGTTPKIDYHTRLGHGGFFSIHPASWGSEQNLVAKVILNSMSPDFAYLEAHFHRAVTRSNIEHMVPLRFLYNETHRDLLCILLPRYSSSLHAYLNDHMADVTMGDAVRIVLTIGRAVAHLHAQNLVHRDIKAQNILVNDGQEVFLADFGTCQHGTDNNTIIGSHPFAPEILHRTAGPESFYEGTAVDVFSLGILLYVIAPKQVYHQALSGITEAHISSLINAPNSYRALIKECISADPKLRPTAVKFVEKLEVIADLVTKSKTCLMCFEQPIFTRCLPCGHKTVCGTCLGYLNRRATARQPPECILCRQVFTGAEEDVDIRTFIGV